MISWINGLVISCHSSVVLVRPDWQLEGRANPGRKERCRMVRLLAFRVLGVVSLRVVPVMFHGGLCALFSEAKHLQVVPGDKS